MGLAQPTARLDRPDFLCHHQYQKLARNIDPEAVVYLQLRTTALLRLKNYENKLDCRY